MIAYLSFIGVLIDYKSIALPAELQGHSYWQLIFIAKVQINQCLKNLTVMFAAVAACSNSYSCEPFVPNLSVRLSV